MAKLTSLFHGFVAVLLSLFALGHCVVLEDIRVYNGRNLIGRDIWKRDFSAFDYQSTETFLFGAPDKGDILLGNLTVEMPGSDENILSMEKFKGMLTKVECTDDSLTLGFEDDKSFAYAQRIWDWVNGADNHTFLMVVGKKDCGDNPTRLPYLVRTIKYDEKANVAYLDAKRGEWKDLAHTYELRVGSVPMSDVGNGLVRRDYTVDNSIDLNANLNFKAKVKTSAVSGDLNCNPCFMAGRLQLALVVKTKLKIPVGLQFTAQPVGVKARAHVTIGVTSNFNQKAGDEVTVGKFPLAGISIPGGILSIGPMLDVKLGYEWSKIEGTFSVSTGATVTMPDSAILQADLLSPENNKFSSWTPSFDTDPLQVQYKLSTALKIYLNPALLLEAEALGQGLETGLQLKTPFLEAKVEGILSKGGGACKAGDPYEVGIKVSPSWGYEIKFTAGKIRGKQNVDVTLSSGSMPLAAPFCKGFDAEKGGPKDIAAPGGGGATPTKPVVTTPTGVTVPKDYGDKEGEGNTCHVPSLGKTGTCMRTGLCKDSAGVSTPGFCPGDKDIQCCTSKETSKTDDKPKGVGEDCTIKTTGKKGTCMLVGVCTGGGKISTPGYCPGDENVQCCTTKNKAYGDEEGEGTTCQVKSLGKTGTCMNVNACKSSDGVSTPGLCPGKENIQCCTSKKDPNPAWPDKTDDGSDDKVKPKPSPSPKPEKGVGEDCTVKTTGKKGTCMTIASCGAAKKVSTPGYCPGASNVQCCTSKTQDYGDQEGEGNTCQVKATGKTGTCMDVKTCKSSDGVSTPGLCPGKSNVQCCTSKVDPKPDYEHPPHNIPVRYMRF